MRLGLFLVMSVLGVCLPHVAEAQQTQRQRHLPYVRAASDCIANAVRRDYEFNNAVQSDNFHGPIGRGIQACKSELMRMMEAHDQIFGSGGAEFFSVDYLNDIDRAVRARLAQVITDTRASLARQAEERAAAEAKARAERLEAENRQRAAQAAKLELARKAQDLVRDRMLSCIGREAASMLLTSETAEVVAKAAMLFCRAEVSAMGDATLDVTEIETGSLSSRAGLKLEAESAVRELVTAHIVKARGELLSKQREPRDDGSPSVNLPKSY